MSANIKNDNSRYVTKIQPMSDDSKCKIKKDLDSRMSIISVMTVLAVTGKLVSDYAETKPALKNVKDKLMKTGKDFSENCKEVFDATKRIRKRKDKFD